MGVSFDWKWIGDYFFFGSCWFSFRERWDEKEGLKRERERPMGGREGGRL